MQQTATKMWLTFENYISELKYILMFIGVFYYCYCYFLKNIQLEQFSLNIKYKYLKNVCLNQSHLMICVKIDSRKLYNDLLRPSWLIWNR